MADKVYVVDKGLEQVVDALIAQGAAKYVTWGTGVTEASQSDSAMQTPAAPYNVNAATGAASKVTTSTAGDTYQVVATLTANSSVAITEVGILNQAALSGATMFLHGTFSPINLNNGDSIEFTIKSQFNQA